MYVHWFVYTHNKQMQRKLQPARAAQYLAVLTPRARDSPPSCGRSRSKGDPLSVARKDRVRPKVNLHGALKHSLLRPASVPLAESASLLPLLDCERCLNGRTPRFSLLGYCSIAMKREKGLGGGVSVQRKGGTTAE